MNMLKAIPVENFRKEDGDFPVNITCSNCGNSSEVYIELIVGGPIMRLCKGCLTDYINIINNTYQNKMSKG